MALALLLRMSGCYGDQLQDLREDFDRFKTNSEIENKFLREQIRLTNRRALCDDEARTFFDGCPGLLDKQQPFCPDKVRYNILRAIGRQRHEVVYFQPPNRIDLIPEKRRERLQRLTAGPLPFTTQFLVLAQPLPGVYNENSEAESRAKSFVRSVLTDAMHVPPDAIIGPRAFPFCVKKEEILRYAAAVDLPGTGETNLPERGIWVFRVDCQ